MPLIPYSCQDIDAADVAAVERVLRSAFLTQGDEVPTFERAFAERHLVRHAVAVSNATAGLHIACLALGVGPGQLVWTSPNSFVASANCAVYCGADIDFVDIDATTRNLSVQALEDKLALAERQGRLPDVVIPVHFAGLPCDLKGIRGLADRYGFKILEDASHATGAMYAGAPIGSAYGEAAVFSFHPVKIITTGEGGIVTTNDDALAARLRLLRSHGITRDRDQMQHAPEGPWYYEQQLLGFNYRLTDMQAALGRSQLGRMDDMRARRAALADAYQELLAPLPLRLPARPHYAESSWHLYVVELDPCVTSISRAEVFSALRTAGIGVNVHYMPIHLQPFYRARGFEAGQFPVAERYYSRAISIPLFPRLTEKQQRDVVDALAAIVLR